MVPAAAGTGVGRRAVALRLGHRLVGFGARRLCARRQGSEVTVALSASPDRAAVTVTDEGSGIKPDERERIFDRFYSKKSAAGERAGSGLGLSIARSIAREHGGDLIAREGPGRGATFELTLLQEPPCAVSAMDGVQDQDRAAGNRTTNRAPTSLPSA